jgi:ABC-type branched-subunit amino acid transport system substrate-binding protein
MPVYQRGLALPLAIAVEESAMAAASQVRSHLLPRRACVGGLLLGAFAALAGCSGSTDLLNSFSTTSPPPAAAPQANAPLGSGTVRVGLILPLSAGGNAGAVALSMKNAAEMALAEFNSPNVQLLVKDDGGNAAGAQAAAQQAVAEGSELIVGPLFAHSVGVVGTVARQRNIPVIAFSTDASVATRGVYLLSFLPESDVDRIVDYAITNGKRSFAAIFSEGAYGNVVEAEFKQMVARKGGRIVVAERYPLDPNKMQTPARLVAQASRSADAVFVPEGPEVVPSIVQAMIHEGLDIKRVQLLGTGLWDDPRIYNDTRLHGAWFAAADNSGFHNFAARYRRRYNGDPVRTATLAYDAVALVAALVKTQGTQGFSDAVLTNPSGFSGIDGLFRFRADGANERGLAVFRVSPTGGQVLSPPPRAFGASGT